MPTLVVAGRDDPSTPLPDLEAIAGEIPGAELVVLERARHLGNVECADDFNAAMAEFL
jgi:3-oxoadipate enol-lactonase/4-carboxymuconolactone decarboxylase